jgi:hypothetical protein
VVSEVRGRLFRKKDDKYLIYLPKDLAEDSIFPFKGADSIFVKVGFKMVATIYLLSNGFLHQSHKTQSNKT